MTMTMQFDAISESRPGPKWHARWRRSWPAYEAWFAARRGDLGPDRAACLAAMQRHMPELIPTYQRLVDVVGGGGREARFLSGWCPPSYLGGCSLAAVADDDSVRLVRNYDLSPDLNEGLLLRTEWVRPVMGMVEFLWGLSDGINDSGLSVALAFGGGSHTGRGFGITHIVRYVLETCGDVGEAIAALRRVPSHMDYNLVLADPSGRTASVELIAGGGIRLRERAIATNHQHGDRAPERPAFTRTRERYGHLEALLDGAPEPSALPDAFRADPLYQTGHAEGFGTLFTAEYDPGAATMALHWPRDKWVQTLQDFKEGTRHVSFDVAQPTNPDWIAAITPWIGGGAADMLDRPWEDVDWQAFARSFAA
ncbi:C45 family peptidase [uncultured Marivita sp.]|uniref:C45 family peptidase n=1 Tax=uncultured Marivita sp. TaxID=888080 RepID=UPI00262CFA64|nr:C45 family peptidase [uncultured Marivita sp.]